VSEPPRGVWYTRNEARLLLADLDEARRTLLDSGHLTVVLFLEEQAGLLRRRLGFEEPGGDSDVR
jgi:hypothetical protein